MSAGTNPASAPGPPSEATPINPCLLSSSDGTSSYQRVFSALPPQSQPPPAGQPTIVLQPFSPATVESTRKHNWTSLPLGTARERELLRLSKLSDMELLNRDDEEILGKIT